MDTLRHMEMAMDSVLQCLNRYTTSHLIFLLSTGNCKIINLSEENILWGFKI